MGNNPSTPFEGRGDEVFTNQLIMWEILELLPSSDIRAWRILNTNFNSIACHILNYRRNAVQPIYKSTTLISYLDTMDNRQEDMIPYSGYTILLTRISSEVVGRFGTDLAYQVRSLTLNFFEPTGWTSALSRMTDFSNTAEWYNEKVKAVQILQLLPNIQELHILYQDSEKNVLDSGLLLLLPSSFPRLTNFKVTDLDDQYQRFLRRIPGMTTDYTSPSTFLTEILRRSPRLKNLEIRRHDTMIPYGITLLPAIFSEFPTPPALTLFLHCLITPQPLPGFERHLPFLQDLVDNGYNRLRFLYLTILAPTSPLMDTFIEFIDLQAPSLESLCLYYVLLEPFFSVRPLMTLPVMPNLKFLEMILYNWTDFEIVPVEFTENHFPKIGPLTVEQNTTIIRRIFRGSLRITGRST